MWVSLINRVYRVLFLALYYHPPPPALPAVPPTSSPSSASAGVAAGRRRCTWGLRKTQASRHPIPILRPLFSRAAVKIYIRAVVYLPRDVSTVSCWEKPSLAFSRSRSEQILRQRAKSDERARYRRVISGYLNMCTFTCSVQLFPPGEKKSTVR